MKYYLHFQYMDINICQLVSDYESKRGSKIRPLFHGIELKELKKAWKQLKLGRTPSNYEGLAEGFATFVKDNCGCTYII